jgi:hypothetical protein
MDLWGGPSGLRQSFCSAPCAPGYFGSPAPGGSPSCKAEAMPHLIHSSQVEDSSG